MVGVRLPDADGLLRSAAQQTTASHQRRPDTGGSHVHSHVVSFRHEEVSWAQKRRAKGPGADEDSENTGTDHERK